MKRIIFLALLYLTFIGLVYAQNTQTNFKTKYVYILVIDGPRYSETYGEPTCKYSPILCDSLKHEGTFYANFKNNVKQMQSR
jgi:hypothetical protein